MELVAWFEMTRLPSLGIRGENGMGFPRLIWSRIHAGPDSGRHFNIRLDPGRDPDSLIRIRGRIRSKHYLKNMGWDPDIWKTSLLSSDFRPSPSSNPNPRRLTASAADATPHVSILLSSSAPPPLPPPPPPLLPPPPNCPRRRNLLTCLPDCPRGRILLVLCPTTSTR